MATTVTIETPPAVDTSKPPANATETTNGGVQIDSSKPNGEQKTDEKKILGKFETQADLEKAYTELEKKLGAAPTTPPTVDQAKEAVKTAGLDMTTLNKEFAEKGELSAESLKALSDKGITKPMVDAYVAGLQSQATALRASLAEVAGGEQGLKNVYDWAQANMTPAEIESYNKTLALGNTDAAKLALYGIVSRFTQATGKEPSLVDGDVAPSRSGEPAFESSAEVTAAMRDPRYQTDEAYRQKVARRLDKTNVFSIRG